MSTASPPPDDSPLHGHTEPVLVREVGEQDISALRAQPQDPVPVEGAQPMRFVSGFLSILFLAGALAAFLADLAVWSGAGWPRLQPLGQYWFDLDPGSLNLLQAVIERYLSPVLWSDVVFPIVLLPAVVVLAVPGIFLFWLSRR